MSVLGRMRFGVRNAWPTLRGGRSGRHLLRVPLGLAAIRNAQVFVTVLEASSYTRSESTWTHAVHADVANLVSSFSNLSTSKLASVTRPGSERPRYGAPTAKANNISSAHFGLQSTDAGLQ
jgi:hypothetical protein